MNEYRPEFYPTSDEDYVIRKEYGGKPSPVAVQFSFVLNGPGWCKLQQSETWHRFLEVLSSIQKEQRRFGHLNRQL